METQRRHFLKTGLGGISLALLANPISKAIADSCGITPKQTSGPFYPGEANFEVGSDLTQIAGRPRAEGTVIVLRGRVLDVACRPVADANVEIWQACESG